MRNRSRWVLLLVAFAMPGVFVLPGCGGSQSSTDATTVGADRQAESVPQRFVFLTNGDDPFFDALFAGLQEGAERFGLTEHGYTVVMEKNNGTAQGQIEKLRQFGSQSDIAGVAISVIQAENVAIAEEMERLRKRGLPVIAVDGDINHELFPHARPYYIGTDNAIAGKLLGTAGKKVLESRGVTEGGFIQFTGFTDNDNARARMNGCRDALGKNYEEIDRMVDAFDHARARDNVRSALVNHPDVRALVGIWAYNAPAIAEVVQERGRREQVTILTFDAAAAAIEHMAAGRIDCMIVQNPFEMGVQASRLLLAMRTEDDAVIKEMFPAQGQPGGDRYTTGLRLILPDAWSQLDYPPVSPGDFGAAEEAGTVEVLSLSVFREWLAKYGLPSS